MKRVFVFAVLMAALTVQSIWADAPQTMSYQGVLNDGSGQPVADGSYSLGFAIYTTTGSQEWSETHSSVATKDGVFSVILGSQGTPLNLPFDEPYELGISVNGGAELSPRMPLASAPYSLNTRTISQVSGTTLISNPARILENGGLTIEESGETGRTLTLTPPGLSTAATLNANSINGLKIETAGPMGLFTNNAERVTIAQNGRVGIGTSSPAGSIHSAIDGHMIVKTNYGYFSTGLAAGMDTGTDNTLTFYTDGLSQPDLYIATDSRVGIGTKNVTGEVSNAAVRVAVNGHVIVNNDYGFYAVNSAGTGFGAGIDAENDNLSLIEHGNRRALVYSGGLQVTGQVTEVSSRRFKTDIQSLRGGLDKVKQLRGVTYVQKEDGSRQIGMIAEEVGAVIPEVVSYEENGVDARAMDYSRLVSVLVEAVKEQQAQIDKQNALINKQQAALEALMSRMAALEKDGETATVKRTGTHSME